MSERHSRVRGTANGDSQAAIHVVVPRARAVVGLYNHATPGRPGQKTIATMNIAATLHEALLFAAAGGLLALVMMRWKPETQSGLIPMLSILAIAVAGRRALARFGAGLEGTKAGHRAARGRAGHRDDRVRPHPAGVRFPGRAGADDAAAHPRRRAVRAVAGRLGHLSDGRARRQSGGHRHDVGNPLASAASRFRCARALANLWGGLALQLDNTYRIGDWVRVDDAMGQVVGIRWRYTSLATNNGETLIIPNSTLVKNRVHVLARRGDLRIPWRRPVEINVGYEWPPSRVIEVIEAALARADMPNVARAPAPSCICAEFRGELDQVRRPVLADRSQPRTC